MQQQYETLFADTSYEVHQKAKQRFGENNYRVIKEESVTNESWCGLIRKAQIKLTVFVEQQSPITDHSMSGTNMSMPNASSGFNNNSFGNNRAPQKEPDVSYSSNVKPIPQIASSLYKSNQRLRQDRKVDGLRSLQEGNEEPHSQKTYDDNNAAQREMLAQMLQIKEKRASLNAINGKTTNLTDNTVSEIFKKLDALVTAMATLHQNAESAKQLEQLPQGLIDLEKELRNIETPEATIDDVCRTLRKTYDGQILNNTQETFLAAKKLLQSRLSFSKEFQLKKSQKPQVIVLMGPTGVGKTTTIAKLASKLCLNPDKPIKTTILNIDFYRLGAREQLQHYADIFEIEMINISSIASLNYCLEHCDSDLIFVDTAGRSQYAQNDIEELKKYIDRIPNATKYLAISSSAKHSDLRDTIQSFGTIGFDHIILTKADETRTIGPAVAALTECKKPLAYITNGQVVPTDYKIADFSFFEEKIFRVCNYKNGFEI